MGALQLYLDFINIFIFSITFNFMAVIFMIILCRRKGRRCLRENTGIRPRAGCPQKPPLRTDGCTHRRDSRFPKNIVQFLLFFLQLSGSSSISSVLPQLYYSWLRHGTGFKRNLRAFFFLFLCKWRYACRLSPQILSSYQTFSPLLILCFSFLYSAFPLLCFSFLYQKQIFRKLCLGNVFGFSKGGYFFSN